MPDEIKVRVFKYPDRKNLVLRYDDPITGKPVTRSAGTADEEKAIGAAAVWQDELTSGRYAAPSRVTWGQFRERYKAEKLAGMPESSQIAYTVALDHLQRVISPDRLCKLTAATMSRFIAEVRKARVVTRGEKKTTRPPMKPGTIARHLRHIKAALRWAERQGMMNKAPAIEMPKLPRGQSPMKGRPIVAEEFDRLIAAVPKVRPRDIPAWQRLLTGLWLSGLRLSEGLALDWDEGSFVLDVSGKHPVFRIEGEGQKSRRGELAPATPDFCQWVLSTFPEGQRAGRVFKLADPGTGKPIDAHRAGVIISGIGRRAKIVTNKAEGRFATAHDLRRSFCTRWAKRVMPAVLQRLARHAHISTTLTFYVAQGAADIAADLWAGWGSEATPGKPQGNISGNIDPKTAKEEGRATRRNPLPAK